ncbi:MAG: hypothetical protein OXH94_01580, partial [Rhodospirillales bacterium]|nr:hypothetical protein [Rhodospirillales bacterium]
LERNAERRMALEVERLSDHLRSDIGIAVSSAEVFTPRQPDRFFDAVSGRGAYNSAKPKHPGGTHGTQNQ